MEQYNHKIIESKWQNIWDKNGENHADDNSDKPKYYCLVEFPYPSGDGLHTGHARSYTAMDILARKRRAEGYNVLYPIGWDAFGLPTENFAIKTKTSPQEVTKQNTDIFRRQLKSLGLSFDWSREINTTDPKYYKWTQWIFLQLFKHGLAYKKKTSINWCIDCKIGLANEEVVNGLCERCNGITEKREKEQWMLAITKYADRLYNDLDTVNYLEKIKIQQRNWIGRSDGALISFALVTTRANADYTQTDADELRKIEIFTTRPDTLFGATYMVLAPEHELIEKLKFPPEADPPSEERIKNWDEVLRYIVISKKKTEIERTAEGREKTGVELKGVKAINPANKEEIPIYIADYVLADYGTGAIMAVPAHDERDYVFAKKFNLPIREVIKGGDITNAAFTGDGELINSGKFDGMVSEESKKKITEFVGGEMKTTYKLRDWVFSRQRYWGEPIPLIFCETCSKKSEAQTNADLTPVTEQSSLRGTAQTNLSAQAGAEGERLNPGWVPVPEENLPVLLPEVEAYTPTDTGESPLAKIDEWVNVKCPKCGEIAKRETDTMPNWAGSSWYYLRYTDPDNDKELASKEKLKYWMTANPVRGRELSSAKNSTAKQRVFSSNGVDWYNGGMEHTTLHLLYSRFWHKFLFDIGAVMDGEPYQKRTSHGMILAEDGEKMSKSKGNIVNPDSIIGTYGADTLRLYEMFMGPFDQAVAWSTKSIIGPRRFLERVWRLKLKIINEKLKVEDSKIKAKLHKTIKKVTADIELMHFNTAVSELMIFANELDKLEKISQEHYEIFLKLLSPFAPHITEEIWQSLDHKTSIHLESWPKYEEKYLESNTMRIAVQVNGKVRAVIELPSTNNEESVKICALDDERVKKWIGEGKIGKIIYVKEKLVSIVLTT